MVMHVCVAAIHALLLACFGNGVQRVSRGLCDMIQGSCAMICGFLSGGGGRTYDYSVMLTVTAIMLPALTLH